MWVFDWAQIQRKRSDAMRSYVWALLVATSLILPAFDCKHVNPKPAPPPGSWLVLLCKASDAPQEPHPASYYLTLFDKNQRDLLFDYFDLTSNHTVDVSGSEVYGWFPMSVDSATIGPNARNNSKPVTRTQTARDCIASSLGGMAVQGFSVDTSKYAGVLTVINIPVDSGDTGEKAVVSNGEPDISFYEHEMIHTYGQANHSWRAARDTTSDHVWNHGTDAEYFDCLDMMSYLTCVRMFQTTGYGGQGPELQTAYRQNLKWFPTGRSMPAGYGLSTATLAPLSDPSKTGSLLVTIEVPGKGSYLVEYREATRFDRGIGPSGVVIRELRNNGITYLVVRQDGSIIWRKGEMFTDTANYLSINVDDIVPGKATVTINTVFSSGAVNAGEICGDKYHGQVRACPAGTQCMARRTGEIQTIDYFCL